MLGDDEGDVVVLFVGTEALDFLNNSSERGLATQFAMTLQGFDKALFAKLFVAGVICFGYAVCVERERIAWAELTFSNLAVPMLKDPEDGSSSVKTLDGVIPAKQ